MNERPPLYEEHAGTIRVAGVSKPLTLAKAAQKLIGESAGQTRCGPLGIDFFYIGGNAGQQAMKAMTILAFQINHESGGRVQAAFVPKRVLTITEDPTGPKEKDASVWSLLLMETTTLPVNS